MSRPWMPLYIADYLADTRRLSTLEHGAYLLLIMEYWQIGDLPQDDSRLARIAGLTSVEWKSVRPAISELFEDGWRHKRIDKELSIAEEKSAKARNAAAARWESERSANGHAPAYADASREHDVSICLNDALSQPQPQPQSEPESQEKRGGKKSLSAEYDRIQALCCAALGRSAPADLVIGPMADLFERFGQEVVIRGLTSEGRRERKKPIKSWRLWATIILEAIEKLPKQPPPPAPGDEMVRYNGSLEMPSKNLEGALRRYADNPESWNPIHGDPPPENPFLVKFAAERGIPIPDKHPDPRGPRIIKFREEAAG